MALTTCTLAIKAIPNARCTEVAGWLGDALKVKVHAPALEGRANVELCTFIADKLGLPKRAVTLAQGEKSRRKLLHIAGISRSEVESRLLDSPSS